MAGAPVNVRFGTVAKAHWASGEKVTIKAEPESSFSGKVSAVVRVTSGAGAKEVPIEFEVQKQDTGNAGAGLVSLATTAGMALGLLVLAVLAILGIISIVSPRK